MKRHDLSAVSTQFSFHFMVAKLFHLIKDFDASIAGLVFRRNVTVSMPFINYRGRFCAIKLIFLFSALDFGGK